MADVGTLILDVKNKQALQSLGQVDSKLGGISDKAVSIGKIIAGSWSFGKLLDVLGKTTKALRDASIASSQFKRIFGDNRKAVEGVRALKNEYQETEITAKQLMTLAARGIAFKVDTTDLATLSERISKVAIDIAAVTGNDTNSVIEKFLAAARNEIDSLGDLGIVLDNSSPKFAAMVEKVKEAYGYTEDAAKGFVNLSNALDIGEVKFKGAYEEAEGIYSILEAIKKILSTDIFTSVGKSLSALLTPLASILQTIAATPILNTMAGFSGAVVTLVGGFMLLKSTVGEVLSVIGDYISGLTQRIGENTVKVGSTVKRYTDIDKFYQPFIDKLNTIYSKKNTNIKELLAITNNIFSNSNKLNEGYLKLKEKAKQDNNKNAEILYDSLLVYNKVNVNYINNKIRALSDGARKGFDDAIDKAFNIPKHKLNSKRIKAVSTVGTDLNKLTESNKRVKKSFSDIGNSVKNTFTDLGLYLTDTTLLLEAGFNNLFSTIVESFNSNSTTLLKTINNSLSLWVDFINDKLEKGFNAFNILVDRFLSDFFKSYRKNRKESKNGNNIDLSSVGGFLGSLAGSIILYVSKTFKAVGKLLQRDFVKTLGKGTATAVKSVGKYLFKLLVGIGKAIVVFTAKLAVLLLKVTAAITAAIAAAPAWVFAAIIAAVASISVLVINYVKTGEWFNFDGFGSAVKEVFMKIGTWIIDQWNNLSEAIVNWWNGNGFVTNDTLAKKAAEASDQFRVNLKNIDDTMTDTIEDYKKSMYKMSIDSKSESDIRKLQKERNNELQAQTEALNDAVKDYLRSRDGLMANIESIKIETKDAAQLRENALKSLQQMSSDINDRKKNIIKLQEEMEYLDEKVAYFDERKAKRLERIHDLTSKAYNYYVSFQDLFAGVLTSLGGMFTPNKLKMLDKRILRYKELMTTLTGDELMDAQVELARMEKERFDLQMESIGKENEALKSTKSFITDIVKQLSDFKNRAVKGIALGTAEGVSYMNTFAAYAPYTDRIVDFEKEQTIMDQRKLMYASKTLDTLKSIKNSIDSNINAEFEAVSI